MHRGSFGFLTPRRPAGRIAYRKCVPTMMQLASWSRLTHPNSGRSSGALSKRVLAAAIGAEKAAAAEEEEPAESNRAILFVGPNVLTRLQSCPADAIGAS